MARTFETDIVITKELGDTESIQWKGAPEAFPLVEEFNKKFIYNRWIICAIAAALMVAAYGILNLAMGVSIWLLVICLLVVAYFIFLPWFDKNSVYKNCKYYITTDRVILYYGERELYSLPLKGLKVNIMDAQEGCVHVELGSCVGTKAKKLRVCAFVPKKDDNGNVTGLVLYNVEDSDILRRIFS